MEKVQKPSNSVCYTPSSEPFRIILYVLASVHKQLSNLVDSKGFWPRCIPLRITKFFGLFPSSDILENRKYDVSETALRLALSKGPNWVGVVSLFNWGRKQIQFPKCRVLYSLEYQTMEKVQKPSNSVCYTPSSEPFRIWSSGCITWSLRYTSNKRTTVASVIARLNSLWLIFVGHAVRKNVSEQSTFIERTTRIYCKVYC
jgi:hypothetical protein